MVTILFDMFRNNLMVIVIVALLLLYIKSGKEHTAGPSSKSCREVNIRLDIFSGTPHHSAVLYDISCHDKEKERLPIRPSRVLVSHTVFSWESAVARWKKDTVGFHYIIKNRGDVVMLVEPFRKAYMAIGCFDHGDNPVCTDSKANDHAVGIMLEGNGCIDKFTPAQHITFLWLVNDLKEKFNIPNNKIHPISDVTRPIGKHIAPCHFFDWHEVAKQLPGVQVPWSWNGSSLEDKAAFVRAVENDPRSIVFRAKWQGFDGKAPLSECLTPGMGKYC